MPKQFDIQQSSNESKMPDEQSTNAFKTDGSSLPTGH